MLRDAMALGSEKRPLNKPTDVDDRRRRL
jgi:hypothetical protein